jgi:hypothetical protein
MQGSDCGPCGEGFVRGDRGIECAVGPRDDGVDLRVDHVDSVEMGPHDVDRGDFAVADQLGQFRRVRLGEVGIHVPILSSRPVVPAGMILCRKPTGKLLRTSRLGIRWWWKSMRDGVGIRPVKPDS